MSKPRKGASRASTKLADDMASERTTPAAVKSDMDAKDETSSNGDKKDIRSSDEASPPKPQSAGASTRDAAQKLLGLAMKQEWTGIEQVMKALEKAVAASGDEANIAPLAGVLDPVSNFNDFYYIFPKRKGLFIFISENIASSYIHNPLF